MDQLDGAVVRTWAHAAADALVRAAARIDAVNVFPVPDADTGTNVRLTVAGGALAAGRAPATADAAQVAHAFARGSLRAARGNSGVIVSQYLEGFAAALADGRAGDGAEPVPDGAPLLAAALVRAAAESAQAVAEPQEGTVLTVAREVGERARQAARAGAPLEAVLGPAVRHARHDLRRISRDNPVLAEAGVVDAGACALLVLLDSLERTLRGDGVPVDPLDWLPGGPTGQPLPPGHGISAGGTFEVMLLVRPPLPDPGLGDRLRTALGAVGRSVAVVGADDLWHVHVHTDRPAAAVAAVATAGAREQVVVRLVEGAAAQVAAGDDLGVVIGTPSPGTAAWFATGGAVVAVRCPETSVDASHLLRAVTDTGARHVVLLPGAPDLLDVARAVAATAGRGELSGVRVDVVEGADDVLRTAVASLALLGSHAAPSERADQARAALRRLRTGDIPEPVDVEVLLSRVGRVVADSPSAQSITLQHAEPVPDPSALLAAVAARVPQLDAVLVGPVGAGPAWRIGVD